MLKKTAIRKILITTLALFILTIIYALPETGKTNVLDSDIEINYVATTNTEVLYLLNEDNLLVKSHVLIEGENLLDKTEAIVNKLIINKNNILPSGLKGILPENTKVLSLELSENIVTINFSKELLNINANLEEKMIESLIYSITELDGVKSIRINIENESLSHLPNSNKTLPEVLDKSYGINKDYNYTTTSNINKVTTYYSTVIDNSNYFVPVTSYVNDDRDKIKIIIDSLSSSYIYQPNLTSYLKETAELIDYSIEEDLMILNFNDDLVNSDNLLEEVIYSISYSVFDNYDVESVIFQENNQEFCKKTKKDIE